MHFIADKKLASDKEKVNNDIANLKRDIEKENLRKSNRESDLRQIEREISALNQRSKELYNVLESGVVLEVFVIFLSIQMNSL